jgi:hypothetical protein
MSEGFVWLLILKFFVVLGGSVGRDVTCWEKPSAASKFTCPPVLEQTIHKLKLKYD